MNKFFTTLIKCAGFLFLWFVGVGAIPVGISTDSPALWRLFAELIPLLVTVILNILFYRFDPDPPEFRPGKRGMGDVVYGLGVGILWLGIPLLALLLSGKIDMLGREEISYSGIWRLSAFLNVMMQVLLIRGYLYERIKKDYGFLPAMVITVFLFTIFHGGAISAGVLPTLNVITMSIFMCVMLEYTDSFVTVILAHGFWNVIGGVVLGVVNLAEDYPSIFRLKLTGSPILSGGEALLEGSVLIFMVNTIFILLYWRLLREKNRVKRGLG